MFKKLYLSQYFMDSSNWGSKFKPYCVESKNGYILLINIINFKLRLINFVYIFVRHPVAKLFMLPSALWEMICLMAYFFVNLLTDKCSKMNITITQAPGSDFTGTSLAVLKGAK